MARARKSAIARLSLPARIGAIEEALKREPKAGDLRLALAEAWLEAGEWQRASSVLARIGSSPSLKTKAAKLGAIAEAMGREARAPEPYVRHLFDQFAPRYDAHMVESLSYRAPEVLRGLADLVGLGWGGALSILDLGCGTGLSGAAFKGLARRLDGVDLSPGMLAIAKTRGLYDRLVCAGLETELARKGRRYDAIIAADTLVYIGALDDVFSAAGSRLARSGMFLFTVEKKPGRSYDLSRKRRYRHSEAYIRETAERAGLEVMGLLACNPRSDAGKPVKGLAVALQRI